MSLPKFIDAHDAACRLAELGEEFALVENPAHVRPAFELCPLAPKTAGPVPRLTATVMDMDGTTTTTEELCLHSLETMVRRITGKPTREDWPGLDREADYPHIIGNSTTRHVEYLVRTYGEHVRKRPFARALLEAAVWTLARGADARRRDEVTATLRALGWAGVLEDAEMRPLLGADDFEPAEHAPALDRLASRHEDELRLDEFPQKVRAAVDVYYHRYHEILSAIARGEGEELSRRLLGGRRLIEPMRGVGVFLALVKGWLGEEAGRFYGLLRGKLAEDAGLFDEATGRARLSALGRAFRDNPLRVAVVTSSIRYEAEIVLREVFSVLREEAASWPVLGGLAGRFKEPRELYDAFITATDSSEIRLKPHRDLYSIALHALGVSPEEFETVLGFEDSESGTVAIRAAGVGLCVAVPFSDTAGHDLSAAAHVLWGGLPEAILRHDLFLKP